MSAANINKWMDLCQYMADNFSTCSKRQYASLVLDSRNRIVGFGYNGVPSGMVHCRDGGCPRVKENSPSGSNYDNCLSIHAEMNALLNCTSTNRYSLFINGTPCFTCSKAIVNAGIKDVFYVEDTSYQQLCLSKNLFQDNDIRFIPIDLTNGSR